MYCKKTMSIGCGFAAGFIGVSLYYYWRKSSVSEKMEYLERVLDDDLMNKYNQICAERRNIFIFSTIVGIILALVYARYHIKHKDYSHWCNVCYTIIIVKVVSIILYMVTPKSQYLMDHIKTAEQGQAWNEVYKEMRYNMIYGYMIGLVCYFVAIIIYSKIKG